MDGTDRDRSAPAPDSAMGGASDMGAHGRHPVSAPELKREHLPVDPDYRGEERRIARR